MILCVCIDLLLRSFSQWWPMEGRTWLLFMAPKFGDIWYLLCMLGEWSTKSCLLTFLWKLIVISFLWGVAKMFGFFFQVKGKILVPMLLRNIGEYDVSPIFSVTSDTWKCDVRCFFKVYSIILPVTPHTGRLGMSGKRLHKWRIAPYKSCVLFLLLL